MSIPPLTAASTVPYASLNIDAPVSSQAQPPTHLSTSNRVRRIVGGTLVVGAVINFGCLIYEMVSTSNSNFKKDPFSLGQHIGFTLGGYGGYLSGVSLFQYPMTAISRLQRTSRIGCRILGNAAAWIAMGLVQKKGHVDSDRTNVNESDLITLGIFTGGIVISFAPEIVESIRRKICGNLC